MPEDASRERSSVVRLQLVLVRALLDRAGDAAHDGTDIGLMLAILLADLGVETLAKTALTDRGSQIDKSSRLPVLLTELQKSVPKLYKREDIFGMARRLREARNPVQHAAAHSGRAVVEALLQDAETVVTAITGAVFNEDFKTISVASLVRTPDLRAALQAATSAINESKFDDALVHAVGAYESLRIRWGKWVRYALGMDLDRERVMPLLVSRAAIAAFGPEHPHTFEPKTEGAWREITLVALGFSVRDLIMIEAARKRLEVLAAERDVASEPTTTRGEAEALVEVIARQIWRLEASQPELLENPPPSMFDNQPSLSSDGNKA